MKRICALMLTALAAAAGAADMMIEKDVAYLPADRAEKADLYLPARRADDAPAPALLWIHGGGFTGGTRSEKRAVNIATNFTARGWVVMSIDYALQKDGAPPVWPKNLHDCKTAVRWLRVHAERLRIDTNRIAVAGGSAGGHLASMVTLTRPEDGLDPAGPHGEFSCAVRCGLNFYGIADLGRWHGRLPMLGASADEDPGRYRRASPIAYVRPDSPPLLILHGTADKTVNVEQSDWLYDALKKAGAPVEFVRVPDAPHTFDLQPKQKDLRPLIFEFLDKHTNGKTTPK